jgi:hypothetical protein
MTALRQGGRGGCGSGPSFRRLEGNGGCFVNRVGVDGLLEARRSRAVVFVVVVVVVGDDEFEQKFADLFGCWEGDFRSMFISLLPSSGETFAGVRVGGRAGTLRRRSGTDGRGAHGRWLLSRKSGVERYGDNFGDLFEKLYLGVYNARRDCLD